MRFTVLTLVVILALYSGVLSSYAQEKASTNEFFEKRAEHLLECIHDWAKDGQYHVAYDGDSFWRALGLEDETYLSKTAKMTAYLKYEDGVVQPLRSGYEVGFYQKIKDFMAARQPLEPLDMDKLLIMVLVASLAKCKGPRNE